MRSFYFFAVHSGIGLNGKDDKGNKAYQVVLNGFGVADWVGF